MERLMKIRVLCSDADIAFTRHKIESIAQGLVNLNILYEDSLGIVIKLKGSINQINEFKNRFVMYDSARKFIIEDIDGDQ